MSKYFICSKICCNTKMYLTINYPDCVDLNVILHFRLGIVLTSMLYYTSGWVLLYNTVTAVLEMKIWIYWSKSNSWICFIYMYKVLLAGGLVFIMRTAVTFTLDLCTHTVFLLHFYKYITNSCIAVIFMPSSLHEYENYILIKSSNIKYVVISTLCVFFRNACTGNLYKEK